MYVLRAKNHAQNIIEIDDHGKEALILHHGVNSPKLELGIAPHESRNLSHEEHILWRDRDGERVDGGVFTIIVPVDNLVLDEHFASLIEPGDFKVRVLQRISLYCTGVNVNSEAGTPAGSKTALRLQDIF